MNLYASDKASHFPDRILALRQGQQPPPAQVLLSLAGICDHSCSWCSFRNPSLPTSALFPDEQGRRNPNRRIPTAKALEIVADCASMGVRAIQFTGGGEPTLHHDFGRIAQAAIDSGMAFGLITNGCHITQELLPVLFRATWVRVSIDAGSAETYSRMHGTSFRNWHKVWDAVVELHELNGPEVGVSFVVQAENYREVPAFARTAKLHGANNVRLTALIHEQGESYFAPFAEKAEALCREAADMEDDSFRVFNLFPTRAAALHPPSQSACHYQHFAPFIGDDLNIYRCCNSAFTETGKIGSIGEQSFRHLWESEAKRLMLAEFDARRCPFCIFEDKNATIAGLVAEPSGHTCFV